MIITAGKTNVTVDVYFTDDDGGDNHLMADNFTAEQVHGVWGETTALFDIATTPSADNAQAVWGEFTIVLDEAAGAAGSAARLLLLNPSGTHGGFETGPYL